MVNEIIMRITKRIEKDEKLKFELPQNNVDVYISHSKFDVDVARKLYDSLTSLGLNVWYNKENLSDISLDDFKNAIRTAKVFLPILSDKINKEIQVETIYRHEWTFAIEVAYSLDRKFIIPLVNRDLDLYCERVHIPEKLLRCNALSFSVDDDFDEFDEESEEEED